MGVASDHSMQCKISVQRFDSLRSAGPGNEVAGLNIGEVIHSTKFYLRWDEEGDDGESL